MRQKLRKCLALLLALAMCVSLLPGSVLAMGAETSTEVNESADLESAVLSEEDAASAEEQGTVDSTEEAEKIADTEEDTTVSKENDSESEDIASESETNEKETSAEKAEDESETSAEVTEAETASVLLTNNGTFSLSCASFISNTDHKKYIDLMMKYYITSNSDLQNTLDEGKSVIFMFEGGSDNYPSSTYVNTPSNIRNQAVVIVVKKDSNGTIGIVSYCEECSSIPGNPENTSGASGDHSTTLKDGIYELSTVNHNGMYGALWVNTDKGYYTPPNNKDGFTNGASGINIHTRSSEKAGGDNWSWAWSEGCQLIGTGNNRDNYFNTFMKVVAGIDYDVWTYYVSSTSSENQLATITTGKDVGYYVVDRQLALDGLTALYNETALNNITEFSRAAYKDADKEDPVITNPYVSNIAEDRSSFTISFTATDNIGVTSVYAMVREQGWNENQAIRIYGSLPDDNGLATVTVNVSEFDGFQGNYYAICYAEDAVGNTVHWEVDGQEVGANPITLYQSVVDDGTYRVTLDGASVRNAPYSAVNGEDTRVYRLSEDDKISIVGSYANDYDNLWYQMQDGNWIYSGNVKLYTKWSEMVDYFKNLASNTIYFICGQAVQPITRSRAISNYSSANLPGKLVSDSSRESSTAVTYLVTFNANGGQTNWTSKSVVVGESYGTLPTPTRFGYTFDGWFTAAEGGNQITSNTICSLTSNQTLYAHWTRIVLLEGSCGDDLSFILYGDGELDITGSGEMTSHPWTNSYAQRVVVVNLPERLTKICNSAFNGCTYLTSINIPDEVINIGEYAFQSTGLTELKLPSNLTTLGYRVFRYCNNLEEIVIPKGVTNGDHSFEESGLKKATIENGATVVANRLFGNAINLTEVNVPDTVTSIKDRAFIGCTNLTNITIPNTVTSIEEYAFQSTGLTELQLPSNLTTLGYRVFKYCNNLEEIVIPKGVTNGDYSFEESGLKKATIENGATVVANRLFGNAINLTEVNIPDTVTSIKYRAFIGCTNLTNITIPNTVTSIEEYAFQSTGLTELQLPSSLTTLGYRVFKYCNNLEEIVIPRKLVNADYSFEESGLKKAILENGITLVANKLFGNANNLSEVNIPDSVKSIGEYAFSGCSILDSIEIPDSVTEIKYRAFINSGLTAFKLSDNIETLGDAVFYNCTQLSTIQWNNKISIVPYEMFRNCTSLEQFELTSIITTIGESAFYGCTSLANINWNDTINRINSNVFENCSSLTEINIPNTITYMGTNVFKNCDALTTVTIPDSVTSLGTSVFYDCDALTDVTLGTGLTSIPNSTFEHCDVLESIVLPYRVASIGASAFKNDIALTSIFIPRATTTIDSTAFSYPDKMTIYGVSGTYAETFANNNGYQFVDQSVSATNVTLNPTALTINKGASATLTMSVTPENFTDEVNWKSSNTSVATISDTGVVKAVDLGTTTIKLTVGNVSASCKVTVVQPVTSISLNKTSLSMEALETYQLTATANPSTANNRDIIWSTSDASVATVDDTGLVTAFGKGSATITAAAADGSGVTKTCAVTVTNTAVIAGTVEEMESPHNYLNNCSDFWVYTLKGAESLEVTFDSRTEVEEEFDFLYIYDGNGNQVGCYTGTELADQTVEVPGDTVRVKLVSDSSGNTWGFKVTSIIDPAQISFAITTQPADITAAVGEIAQFRIEVQGIDLSYQWQYQNVGTTVWKASGQSGSKTSILSVPVTEARNGQKYRCVVTDGSGEQMISNEATLYVEKTEEELMIMSQPANYTGEAGETAVFKVEAKGEGLSYQWQYQNAGTTVWKASGQSGNKTNSLNVPITEARNGQKYRCVITDENGNQVISDEAVLYVGSSAGTDIIITSQPADYTGAVGDTAAFTVKAEGEELSYQWQYQNAGTTVWKASGQSGNKTGSLSVPITEARNGQKYRCVITDGAGNQITSDAATLYVGSASVTELAIISQPTDYTGVVGETAVFTVEAAGDGLSYQWQYQNAGTTVWKTSSQTGNRTNSLKVPITAARDGQKYRCMVTDSHGNTMESDAAALIVNN